MPLLTQRLALVAPLLFAITPMAEAQVLQNPARSTVSGRQTPVQRLPAAQPQTAGQVSQRAPAPFQLTQEQQVLLDQVLDVWEKESNKIQTFRCTFERWEYDPVFLKNGDQTPVTKSSGQLKYAKPDKGLFRITEIRRFDPKQDNWNVSDEAGEHWVCNGKAIYEFNATKKQLIVRDLPPELRGTAIVDGPLPFLFGAEARKLKRRYFIWVTEATENEFWLEAYPRYQRDAANYQKVQLILDRRRFLPSALQVFLPNGKSRTVYLFHSEGAKVNDPLERFIGVFQQPRTPFGWTKIVEPAPQASARQADRTVPRPTH